MNVLIWLTNYLVTYSFGKLEIWGTQREGELMEVDTGFRSGYKLIRYAQREKKAKRTNKHNPISSAHSFKASYFLCLPLWLDYKLLKVKVCVLASYFSMSSTYQALNKYLLDCYIY